VATADHNTPTIDQHLPIKDDLSRNQLEQLTTNCADNNITLYELGHKYNGIVHVMAPELGITQPGMTMVCGDSHTSTHGAFGAIAFGIGTSQVAQVFASQCLLLTKPKSLRVNVHGKLSKGVLPKDVILYIISKLGTNSGTGYFCEYAGDVFKDMSMEGRMTVCNMSIEMGARGGMIAPDQTTYDYIKGRKFAPKGIEFDEKVAYGIHYLQIMMLFLIKNILLMQKILDQCLPMEQILEWELKLQKLFLYTKMLHSKNHWNI